MKSLVLLLSMVLVTPALAGPKKSIPPRKVERTVCDGTRRAHHEPVKDRVELFERSAPVFTSLVQAPTTFEPATRLNP